MATDIDNTSERTDNELGSVPTPSERGPGSRRGGAWLWAVPLLFLISLISYLMRDGDEPQLAAEATVQQPAIPRAPLPDPLKPVGTSGFISSPVGRSSSVGRSPFVGRESGAYRIEFQAGSSGITSASENELLDIAAILNANAGTRADITGYTDATGSAEANSSLADADATAMMNKLVSLGVDRSRLKAEGYGGEATADNTTAEGQQPTRRVEIRVITVR